MDIGSPDLRYLLAVSTGNVWEADFASGRLAHSGHIKQLLGYSPGEIDDTVKSWVRITHPEDRDLVCKAWRGHLTERLPYDIKYRARSKSGAYRWFTSKGQAAWDESGRATRMVGVIHDITTARAAEAENQASFERFRKVFHLSPVATSLSGLHDARLLDVNDAFCAFFGRAREEMLGRTTLDMGLIVDPMERELLVRRLLDERRLRDADMQVRLRSGDVRKVLVSAEVVDFMGETCAVVTFKDVTDRRRYEARIEYLATHDELTGLPNRTLMRDRVSQALARARRCGTQLALMFLDLDRFKVINDGFGHPFGDGLLKETARRLQAQMRAGDTVARLGGDEFLILLADLRRSADAYVVAQKILDSFEKPFLYGGREAHINTSIGVALFPQDGQDVDTLITHADVAMYRSKDLGRGIYQFFNSEMRRETQRRVEIETHLRAAFARQGLHLRYQPKIDIATGRITGSEALLGWNDPTLGSVPPSQFIPIAEDSGLIVPIGDWVLQTACAQSKAWQDAGLAPGTVAVNLSARQFLRQDVVTRVLGALEAAGLAPDRLELELTESVLALDPDSVAATMRELKSVGVRFSIDDFGTGYSSLSYLKRFPVDALKIDQSFVRNICAHPDDEAISLAVISLAHSLRLKVIAEGVETAEQRDFLRRHGCDEVQGYFYSRPLPGHAFAAMLEGGERVAS